jgi:hypothetical protein
MKAMPGRISRRANNRRRIVSPNRREFLGMSCSCLGLMAALDLKSFASPREPDLLADWTAASEEDSGRRILSWPQVPEKARRVRRVATGSASLGRGDNAAMSGRHGDRAVHQVDQGGDKEGQQKCQRLTKSTSTGGRSLPPPLRRDQTALRYKTMGEGFGVPPGAIRAGIPEG